MLKKEISQKVKNINDFNEEEEAQYIEDIEENEDYQQNDFEEEEEKNEQIEEDFDLEKIINKNIQKQLQKLNEEDEVKPNPILTNNEISSLREKRDELLMIKEEQGFL